MYKLIWVIRAKLAYWITPPLYPSHKGENTFVAKIHDGRGDAICVRVNQKGKVHFVRCQE